MAGVGAILDAVFGSYDLKVSRQWRDEDLRYREQEKQWREDAILREITWRHEDIEREQRLFKLANEKRMIDARQRQLIAVIKLATVLGGFNMAAIVEITIPENFSQTVMAIYAGVAVLQFLCMFICTLICTLLLMAITRFVAHTLETEIRSLETVDLDLVSPFNMYWLMRCESEWMLAYRLFYGGLSFFSMLVILIGLIQCRQSIIARIMITVLCTATTLLWKIRIASKWQFLVSSPDWIPSTPNSAVRAPAFSAS
uniref:Uncharacterized protein AlNc14C281G10112 n=1 Tax=Albugo laibachii Nc14 TaxID=890382 RepID=F0WC51_9STRA|nr:conserved hypothetical protein [Albugo laibachii Nc14]CCA25200.1 conserved hypothetical protein [Albugo laibachii Nc14]|eukprot:CCA25200.1 conserved hypothetical protein [Albugo laibachii Nc14]